MVKAAPGVLHWIVYSPSASADSMDVRNASSTSLTASSLLAIDTLATNIGSLTQLGRFDPPIKFTTGIFVTITNLTSVTLGFE